MPPAATVLYYFFRTNLKVHALLLFLGLPGLGYYQVSGSVSPLSGNSYTARLICHWIMHRPTNFGTALYCSALRRCCSCFCTLAPMRSTSPKPGRRERGEDKSDAKCIIYHRTDRLYTYPTSQRVASLANRRLHVTIGLGSMTVVGSAQ